MMMARLADDVRTIGTTGFFRQRGGLSSFQILGSRVLILSSYVDFTNARVG